MTPNPARAGSCATVVASAQPCPVCGKPMPAGRTAACSAKCRAKLSRRRKAEAVAARERELLAELEAARKRERERIDLEEEVRIGLMVQRGMVDELLARVERRRTS